VAYRLTAFSSGEPVAIGNKNQACDLSEMRDGVDLEEIDRGDRRGPGGQNRFQLSAAR